jgi:N-acetylneuraminate synthase/N,N'-diacetyllegionaminate synthase
MTPVSTAIAREPQSSASNDFAIGGRSIGPGCPPYIVAEIGVNHDGNMVRGQDLVRAAKQAGADAVKFQVFEADRLLSLDAVLARYQEAAGATDPRDMLRELELPIELLDMLCREARDAGLHAITTVFSTELVSGAETLGVDAYKTASPDIVHRPLLERLADTGRPLIVSTGGATLAEVERARGWLGRRTIGLLQCVSSYPTPDDEAALGGIAELARAVPGVVVGYSDHTTSVDSGALAVAAGACILEKHITYDRTAVGPDHAASLDPAQFVEYVRLAHRAHRMLGRGKSVRPIEGDVRSVSRQSLVLARSMRAGERLAAADLVVKRPGTGIAPFRIGEIVGRALVRDVDVDRVLRDEDLA